MEIIGTGSIIVRDGAYYSCQFEFIWKVKAIYGNDCMNLISFYFTGEG
jgi:hypothetical protein